MLIKESKTFCQQAKCWFRCQMSRWEIISRTFGELLNTILVYNHFITVSSLTREEQANRNQLSRMTIVRCTLILFESVLQIPCTRSSRQSTSGYISKVEPFPASVAFHLPPSRRRDEYVICAYQNPTGIFQVSRAMASVTVMKSNGETSESWCTATLIEKSFVTRMLHWTWLFAS